MLQYSLIAMIDTMKKIRIPILYIPLYTHTNTQTHTPFSLIPLNWKSNRIEEEREILDYEIQMNEHIWNVHRTNLIKEETEQ